MGKSETENLKQFVTEDVTPTWESLVPVFLAVLEDGTEEGKKSVRHEIKRMAKAADNFNQLNKETQTNG